MPDPEERGDSVPATFAELREAVGLALAHRAQGSDDDALRAAELARRALPGVDVPTTRDGAHTLALLGTTYLELGYDRRAKDAYRRSLAIVERLEPVDDKALEHLLNNLGQVEQRLGDPERARSLLERSVALGEARAPGSVELARAVDNLGTVHFQLGDLARAEALHHRALEVFRRANGPVDDDLATTLGNLSNVYAVRGELDRAEAFRWRALDTHLRLHGPMAPGALLAVAQLVDLFLRKGDQPRVDRLVNHLLSLGGATPRRDHRNLAGLLAELAGTALADFRLDLAARCYARAVELLDALEGPDAPETLAAVRLLGTVQLATGDLVAAERSLRRVLDGFDALGSEEATAALIDLGKVYGARQAHDVAEQLLGEALDRLRRQDPPDRRQLASALGNLAELRYEAGRYEEADRTYGEALEAVGDADGEEERPWLLHGLATLRYHRGRYAEARELYEEARRRWAERLGPEHPFVARALANLALVHWAEGDADAALAAFAASAAARDLELRRILAVGSERTRLAYARRLLGDLHQVLSFRFALARRRPAVDRFAAELALQRKGRVLDAVTHTVTRLRETGDAEAEALIDRLQAVRTQLAALVTPVPLSRRPPPGGAALARLREQEERLEEALSHRGALADPDLDPVTLESVQRALPAGGALLDYLRWSRFDPRREDGREPWAEERYAALVVRPSGAPRWFDLGPAATVDGRLDQLGRLLWGRSSPLDACQELAAEVHALVVEPLSEALGDARRLLVSPDGKLAMVPFGLLADGAGRRLAERATVSYLTSARELARRPGAAPGTAGVVVVADPDFAGRGPFAPLAGTRGEADDLAALLEGVTVLDGAAATADAVRRVRRPAVLHLATHGFFSPLDELELTEGVALLPLPGASLVRWTEVVPVANPMYFSGVALAGANRRVPGTGILTAQEIAGLDLRGTQLVVLSACQSGLGTVKRGEEFLGLRRALSVAGAATQVTSLWKVDDEATRALMGRFYRWLVKGRGRAEALQLAQEQVERDPRHPEWAHPFFWAGFVLSGAWEPVPGGLPARGPAP